jgi:hypothetical protein
VSITSNAALAPAQTLDGAVAGQLQFTPQGKEKKVVGTPVEMSGNSRLRNPAPFGRIPGRTLKEIGP